MEFNILEEKKGRMVFELSGATHTICNILKGELWKEKGVKTVTYIVDHPLVGTPRFTLETEGGDHKKMIVSACNRLKKDFSKFSDDIKKEVK